MQTLCTNNQRYLRFQFILPRIPSLSFFDICSIWSGLVVNPERRDMLISFCQSFIHGLCCGTLCGQGRREIWGGGGKGRGRAGLWWVPGSLGDFELEMRQTFERSLSDLSGWDRSDRQPQTLPPHHYLQDHPSGLRQPLSPPLCVFLLSVSLF